MVIGGDGVLGSSITETLKKSGKRVITTSRKKKKLSESCIYLDLKDDMKLWEIPYDVDLAFICAAVSSIDQCRNYPQESKIVNVENTLKLADKLTRKGTSIIFPSTNLVFDGQSPNRRADDPIAPCFEYGRQKAATEAGLMNLGQNISIVRFTKILSPQTSLINDWIKQLKKKMVIHPFSDIVLAPITIDLAVDVLIEKANRKSCGIWQVSAKEDITYEDLARHLAKKVAVSQECVHPINALDSGMFFESMLKYTTLDTSRLQREFGIDPPDPFDSVDSLFSIFYENSQ